MIAITKIIAAQDVMHDSIIEKSMFDSENGFLLF